MRGCEPYGCDENIITHPGDIAKIADIVDGKPKTEYDNLYTDYASVIPERFGLPKTITILAQAKRLTKHLAGE